MATDSPARAARLTPVLRDEERVTPLELFFDLVFVLAITQCTALMAADPSWEGLARGLLVLGVIWWAWVGYAWLTSVVNPEEGLVRIAIFGAMAGLLVCSLAIPEAFGEEALLFAISYGVIRMGQIVLFTLASRDDANLRKSVTGLGISTAIAVGLLLAASGFDGTTQGAIWALLIAIDVGGPLLFGVEGWKLEPMHFAERHGLIVLIALGESIVAIGVGAQHGVDAGIVAAAVLGIAVAAAFWWLYFDVVATVAASRLARRAEPGREQNAIARDSYSILHFPMVAGIVLVALGMKKTLGHVGEPLKIEVATALLGGAALYLLGHVAFRLRNIQTLNKQRLLTAVALCALIPLAVEIDALLTLAIVTTIFITLIVYETIRFAEARNRIRHQLARELAGG